MKVASARRRARSKVIAIGASARLEPRRVSIAARLVAGLAALIVAGTGLLSLPIMGNEPVAIGEALFTATSAATVTGLSLSPIAVTYSPLGQITIMLLVQIGGAGFMVALVSAHRLVRHQISLADRLAVASALGVESPRAILSLVQRAVTLILLIEAAGAVALYVHWTRSGIVHGGQAAFYAVFSAVTAFCNAGFDLFGGGKGGAGAMPRDYVTMLILGTLVFVGGLGIPVYMETVAWRSRRRWSLHSRVTIVAAVLLVGIGMVALLAAEYRSDGVLAGMPFHRRLIEAWFQSVSARTAGFAGITDFEQLSQASRLSLAGLMFIGTAPASMGGGITTGTLVVLVLATMSLASGHRSVRVSGRTLSQAAVWRASVVLVTSLAAVIAVSWLILLTHPVTVDVAMFEVISAFSTTGLSLGLTSELTPFGRALIIFMMFWGRLGAATLVIAMLQGRRSQHRIDFAEESILVG